jgi:hypothetical protein
MYFDHMDHGNAFSFQLSFCFSRYIKLVLESNSYFKSKPKFLMAWRFGALPTTMYTPKIEANWVLKHRGGGGLYLDMPKGMIPYDETSLHNEYVAKQTISNVGGA